MDDCRTRRRGYIVRERFRAMVLLNLIEMLLHFFAEVGILFVEIEGEFLDLVVSAGGLLGLLGLLFPFLLILTGDLAEAELRFGGPGGEGHDSHCRHRESNVDTLHCKPHFMYLSVKLSISLRSSSDQDRGLKL